MAKRLSAIFHSLPLLVLMPGGPAGYLLFAVTLLLHPNMAYACVLATGGACGTAWLLRMHDQLRFPGPLLYNPMLMGLLLGSMTQLTMLTAGVAVLLGAMTLALTAALNATLGAWLRLPVLSLPFVVASTIWCLAALRYGPALPPAQPGAAVLSETFNLPVFWASYFRCVGALIDMPFVFVGILLAWLLLMHSRIAFLLGLAGYAAGTFVRAQLLQSWPLALQDVSSFNFILTAIALGGVFLIPSPTSYAISLMGVAACAVLIDSLGALWEPFGVPIFPLPFVLVTLGTLAVLHQVNHPVLARLPGQSPEQTLEYALTNKLRYAGRERTLRLPFNGLWTVWQAPEGPWTHQGKWKHAYDFVITDAEGRTHRGAGMNLTDHYCFRKPVLAPAAGRVVQVVSHLPDHPVGQVDKANNWGNFVILHDPRGYWVELSHFAENSIRVKVGEWVEAGTVLGLCGNSGYSPLPHLHVHVQESPGPGAATLPFSFAGYLRGKEHHANDLPAAGDEVQHALPDRLLEEAMTLLLDDELRFDVFRRGQRVAMLEARVGMAIDGTCYLGTSRGKLYFGKHDGTFYFYRLEGNDPWLRLLFRALPRLPVTSSLPLTWNDHLPMGVAVGTLAHSVALLLAAVMPSAARVDVLCRRVSPSIIQSQMEVPLFRLRKAARVELDALGRLSRVQCDDVELVRVLESLPAPANVPAEAEPVSLEPIPAGA